MLEIANLHLWRGDRHLLKGVSLSLGRGEFVQMLWPNGTGKTSLMRCVAGFLHAEEGDIRWKGVATVRNRDAFHRDLAWLSYEAALKSDLTVMENLRLACAMRRHVTDEEIARTLQALGLPTAALTQTARTLSAGQQRRCALARLALWDAELWLLDEPLSNLDAAGQEDFAALLGGHLARGGMALMATHQALRVPGVASRQWVSPELQA
jgi:heme exporter protein A